MYSRFYIRCWVGLNNLVWNFFGLQAQFCSVINFDLIIFDWVWLAWNWDDYSVAIIGWLLSTCWKAALFWRTIWMWRSCKRGREIRGFSNVIRSCGLILAVAEGLWSICSPSWTGWMLQSSSARTEGTSNENCLFENAQWQIKSNKSENEQKPTCLRMFSNFFCNSFSRFCSATNSLFSKMCFFSKAFSFSRTSAVILTSANLVVFCFVLWMFVCHVRFVVVVVVVDSEQNNPKIWKMRKKI